MFVKCFEKFCILWVIRYFENFLNANYFGSLSLSITPAIRNIANLRQI